MSCDAERGREKMSDKREKERERKKEETERTSELPVNSIPSRSTLNDLVVSNEETIQGLARNELEKRRRDVGG